MEEQTARRIPIATEFIKLDAFLKFAGVMDTGGAAKWAIQAGEVSVNGAVCRERGRKLRPGDLVTLPGVALTLTCE